MFNKENLFNKENRSPNIGVTSLQYLDDHFQQFKNELNNLLKWIKAGENEVFLRQYFDLNPKNGYSIPIFDFIVYFKDADLSFESVLPYKYMRVLYLAEYVVKVLTQIKKYQNFHKKHDIVLKVWHQLVRIIGSMPAYTSTSNLPANVVEPLNLLQQQRLAIIRGYVQRCQQRPQSKSEQLEYLQTILKLFLDIENEEERLMSQIFSESDLSTTGTCNIHADFDDASTQVAAQDATLDATLPLKVNAPSSAVIDTRLRLLDFCRLWRTRYNNDSRIVVNTTDEQLDQRQMFCRSSNSISTFFDWFSKNPCNSQNILSLTEHIGAFVNLNNTRNAYNCSIGSVRNPINGKYFGFTVQEFVTDLLPYLRCCIHTLNRLSTLQSQKHLSLFESFWDISFLAQVLNVIRFAVLQNASLQDSNPIAGKGKVAISASKRRFADAMGTPFSAINANTMKESQFYQREDSAAIVAVE